MREQRGAGRCRPAAGRGAPGHTLRATRHAAPRRATPNPCNSLCCSRAGNVSARRSPGGQLAGLLQPAARERPASSPAVGGAATALPPPPLLQICIVSIIFPVLLYKSCCSRETEPNACNYTGGWSCTRRCIPMQGARPHGGGFSSVKGCAQPDNTVPLNLIFSLRQGKP